MDQLTCKLDPSRNTDHRVQQCGKFSVGAELASALKVLAWTWARATDCDLQSGSRKIISVCGLSVSSSLSFSPCLCLPVSLFFATLFFVPGHYVQRTQHQHPAQHQPLGVRVPITRTSCLPNHFSVMVTPEAETSFLISQCHSETHCQQGFFFPYGAMAVLSSPSPFLTFSIFITVSVFIFIFQCPFSYRKNRILRIIRTEFINCHADLCNFHVIRASIGLENGP